MIRNWNLTKIATYATCLALLATIWLHPAVLAAQEAAGEAQYDTGAQEILLMIVKVVFSILSLFTTYLVTKAITYFEKKTNIDIPAATEALMFEWADKGIGLAFERSHQKVKKLGEKLKGPEKLDIALKFVAGMAKEYGLPEKAEDKLVQYIESKLGLKRKDAGVLLEEAEEANVPPDNG